MWWEVVKRKKPPVKVGSSGRKEISREMEEDIDTVVDESENTQLRNRAKSNKQEMRLKRLMDKENSKRHPSEQLSEEYYKEGRAS